MKKSSFPLTFCSDSTPSPYPSNSNTTLNTTMVVPVREKMDHYKVLGVGRSATPDDIKSAFRSLARELHPDKNKEAGAEDRFKTLSISYEILGSPRKKRSYDLLLGEWGKGPQFNGARRRTPTTGHTDEYVPPNCGRSDASFNRSLSHDTHAEMQQARSLRAEKLKRARDLKAYTPEAGMKKPVGVGAGTGVGVPPAVPKAPVRPKKREETKSRERSGAPSPQHPASPNVKKEKRGDKGVSVGIGVGGHKAAGNVPKASQTVGYQTQAAPQSLSSLNSELQAGKVKKEKKEAKKVPKVAEKKNVNTARRRAATRAARNISNSPSRARSNTPSRSPSRPVGGGGGGAGAGAGVTTSGPLRPVPSLWRSFSGLSLPPTYPTLPANR